MGLMEWDKNQNPKIPLGLPTKPPKNPWTKKLTPPKNPKRSTPLGVCCDIE